MPFFDSLARRNRRNVPLPEGIDWSRRANPARRPEALDPLARTDGFIVMGNNRYAAQNATYMRLKLLQNSGVIKGYHGTSTMAADAIAASAVRPGWHQEARRSGISAWDSVVALEALRFARMRAQEAGELGEGKIVELEMENPHEDSWHGRLEWLSDPKRTKVLEIYSPDEFRQYIGQLAAEGAIGIDTRDPYSEGL